MSLTDERYKQLMVDVGMPNSRSLLQALQQVANEVEQNRNARAIEAEATKPQPDSWQYRMSSGEWSYLADSEVEKSIKRGWTVRPLYATPQPIQKPQEPVAEVVREYFAGRDHWDFKVFDQSLQHGTKMFTTPQPCPKCAELGSEVRHWKSNHATVVAQARILKEREDMPIERVKAYEKWQETEKRCAALEAEVRKLCLDALTAEEQADEQIKELERQLRYERENPVFEWKCDAWQAACGIARQKVVELEAERDTWKARTEFSFTHRDELTQERDALKKQNGAYKVLTESKVNQLAEYRAMADKFREAISTLESEKEANAVLTQEIAKLKESK